MTNKDKLQPQDYSNWIINGDILAENVALSSEDNRNLTPPTVLTPEQNRRKEEIVKAIGKQIIYHREVVEALENKFTSFSVGYGVVMPKSSMFKEYEVYADDPLMSFDELNHSLRYLYPKRQMADRTRNLILRTGAYKKGLLACKDDDPNITPQQYQESNYINVRVLGENYRSGELAETVGYGAPTLKLVGELLDFWHKNNDPKPNIS